METGVANSPRILDQNGREIRMSGGFEGASRLSREVALWSPSIGSADSDLTHDKQMLDARSRDMARNDPLIASAVQIHRDAIVGAHYKLNARPNWKILGLTEDWAEEFQQVAEDKFTLYAESPNHWVDASRMNTFTSLIRLVTAIYTVCGEVLGTVEWLRDNGRPFNTAIQLVDVDRLSNPNNVTDSRFLRSGVEKNRWGAPVAYHIRVSHPGDMYDQRDYRWKRVPIRKPWGRLQVMHILEQHRVDQSRGIGDMVAALKEMRMAKKLKDITLQSMVLNATYAAAIESDLPPDQAFDSIGAGDDKDSWVESYLSQIAEYSSHSKNMHLDGVKIPHLFPGTKLKLMTPGQPGTVGTAFEDSLDRHVAASFGMSAEEFNRSFANSNYSAARASLGESDKFKKGRKKVVADRAANIIYSLIIEEMMNAGELPLPSNAPNFYEGLNKEAYCQASWVGQGRGQIDELKETQAAILRIKAGISTYEKECARFGDDFRDTFAQRAREEGLIEKLSIPIALDSAGVKGQEKPGQKTNGQLEDSDDDE